MGAGDNLTFRPGIAANPVIAVDQSPGPFNGRIYLAYVDNISIPFDHDDTEVFIRFSDDQGLSWSGPQQVNDLVNDGLNDDATQFNPALSVDPITGTVVVTWYDTRLDPNNERTDVFMSVVSPGSLSVNISPDIRISEVSSDQSFGSAGPADADGYGQYMDVEVRDGVVHVLWTDTRFKNGTVTPAEEIFTTRVDLNLLNASGLPVGGITDKVGNQLDGEAIGVSEDGVGLPSGDGIPGGNFVASATVAATIINVDSSFEEDPFIVSDGTTDNPFPTLQRGLGKALGYGNNGIPEGFILGGDDELIGIDVPRPTVVKVRNGNGVPYIVEPPPGGLDGTIHVPDFTVLNLESGTIVKLRSSNIDTSGAIDLDEDVDNDGRLDLLEADLNGNGILDPVEDLDNDGRFDVDEDINGDGLLNLPDGIVDIFAPGAVFQARGTVIDPIRITSALNDDALVGGDTNGDGNNSGPLGGDWGGILFRAGSDNPLSIIDQAVLDFGGGPVPAAISPRFDTIFLESTPTRPVSPAITNILMTNNGVAGSADGMQFSISANMNSFVDSTNAELDGSADGTVGPLIRNITLRDNSVNAIWVRPSSETGRATLAPGLVAKWDDPIVHVLDSLVEIIGSGTMDPTQFTINPGMVVKGLNAAIDIAPGSEFNIGRDGPGDPRTVLTSFFDDSAGFQDAGFDTNNDGVFGIDLDALGPNPGDWAGLDISSSLDSPTFMLIDESDILYGGGTHPLGNLVPSLGISGPGYFQVTRNEFQFDASFAPIQVVGSVLRADVPFDVASTPLADEFDLVENPLFRGNILENNNNNGMLVIPFAVADGRLATVEASRHKRQRRDRNKRRHRHPVR